MKKYIDLNTKLRPNAKNDFEKDFLKLMTNSVFGKTMENIRKRVDVRLVNDREKARKLASKPNFESVKIFDENLIAINMKKKSLTFDKPIYCGMSILEISKTLMYEFHYKYIKPKYGDLSKLISLQIHIVFVMRLKQMTFSRISAEILKSGSTQVISQEITIKNSK